MEKISSRTNLLRGVIFGTLILSGACSGKLLGVNVTVVDQKTALENQILGSYEELGNEMLMVASVRSVDEQGKLRTVAEIPKGKKIAIRAMQRQEFNKDDILKFKQTSCAGENNEGLLVYFENEETKKNSRYREFVQTLIKEENEDRLTILNRIVATNENFSEGDLPKVQKIYAGLNRKNAKPNEKVQQEDGTWITVK